MSPVRVIDVPGLGEQGVLVDTLTGPLLLLDPSMPHEARVDYLEQAMDQEAESS